MIKKKVKKIPKYSIGSSGITPGGYDPNMFNKSTLYKPSILNSDAVQSFNQATNAVNTTLSLDNPTLYNQQQFNQQMNQGLNNPTKNTQNDLRGMLGSTASGAGLGFMVGGPMGAGIGAAAGLLVDTLPKIIGTGGSVDQNTGEIQYASGLGKIFGRSDAALRRESNRVKNVNLSRVQTENLKTDYYNNPNVPTSVNVLAAEGGVMRQPVDALVSKGELIYDPETKQLSKVPGSKGKPNKKDDVAVKLHEGDIVVSNSPTMLMANGKTPAQNLENMVTIDKKKNNKLSEGTIKAREAVIKKVVNWQEANKTKPQEYAKFDGGTANVKSADDVSYNNDMYMQMLSMLPMINALNFDKYNNLQNTYATLGFTDKKPGDNLKKSKAIEDYQKLYEALTLGNERIRAMQNEGRIQGRNGSADKPETWFDGLGGTQTWLRHLGKNLSKEQLDEVNLLLAKQGLEAFHNTNGMINYRKLNKPVNAKITPIHPEIEEEIVDELPIPDAEKWAADPQGQYKKGLRKLRLQNLIKPFGKMGDVISDIAPLAVAMFGNYDYHTEQPYINPAKYVPTGVNIDPIRRAADESYAMTRYNQANINPNTGAGMAYSLQAASNRAKTLADAYQWQQEQQNKLIGQNVGIYNTWAPMEAQARHTANTETRQNEGAAQQMRDSAIRDAIEFTYGRRNDKMRLAMLEPMFKYAVDDNIWKKFRV